MHILQDMYKETSVLRPVEVFTAVERRRSWSAQDKARIVAESFEPGAKVTEVARRHELSAQHLHQWRRAAKTGKMVLPIDKEMTFAAVMVDGAPVAKDGAIQPDMSRPGLGLTLKERDAERYAA